MLINLIPLTQRIQYAKTKSDVIAKADGTFVPRERRRRHDDRGNNNFTFLLLVSLLIVAFNSFFVEKIVSTEYILIIIYGTIENYFTGIEALI